MDRLDATRIDHHDVVVVGGGVAGIATAELVARRTKLSVKLLERAQKLGTGASGRLEGWFHTGALYSAVDDGQTFINSVNALEDLVNVYSTYFVGRCNVRLVQRPSGVHVPAFESDDAQGEGGNGVREWFNGPPIYYVQPTARSPEMIASRLQNDRVLLEIERERVRNRMEAGFGDVHDWRHVDGSCRAPILADIEARQTTKCSLLTLMPALDELCSRYDRSFGCEPSGYEFLRSTDITVDTATVLRDLVASALAAGVDIQRGMTIESLVLDPYGPLRIKSLLCRNARGENVQVKARAFVFAVGADFEEYLRQLGVRVRVKKHKSAMVVASPELSDVNFARMSMNPRHHFNHLMQSGRAGGREYRYSMLANSGFAESDSDRVEEVTSIDALLDSAERYFGADALYGGELFGYSCMKTEFLSEIDEKRRYSYWIEVDPASNYVCVLPGKFSFFPTVAYQTLLRIGTMLAPEQRTETHSFSPPDDLVRRARELVADHYPLRVLSSATS